MKPIRTFTVLPILPKKIAILKDIAYNYWWAWDSDGRELFSRMDKKLWEEVKHNPVKLLNLIPQKQLEALANQSDFVSYAYSVHRKFEDYMGDSTWYQAQECQEENRIAYFCAEFGIHESFPNYSGGLGMLAGDHLKSASDLGLPLVGIGLLYQEGYFHQYLTQNGWQNESYIENDFYSMPIELIKDENDKTLVVDVDLPLAKVYAQVWRVAVGRVSLFLLDTNIPQNTLPEYRDITDQLYGGNRDTRIQQEIILGIGGFRALQAMNLTPTVCHINEGHAAFMTLERTRALMQQLHLDFRSAQEIARAGNVFTTHTPVPAGNEVFTVELMEKYLGKYYSSLGLSSDEFFSLGRQNPTDTSESFSMTVLGLRLAAYHNGVSKLHGEVAREMWHKVWQDFPVNEVPITAVTNGIHTQTWASKEICELYDRYLTPRWRTETANQSVWDDVENIPDEELWRLHERRRERLIIFARNHLRDKLGKFSTPEQVIRVNDFLNPDALTVGFARRFATYKRGTLLFGDMERLSLLVTHKERPVQFIIAGKAHPHDIAGKEIIQIIVENVKKYNLDHRIIFLEDYDMAVARYLVKGCDVWLNTPRRPFEASGTSGMKAAVNGCLHVSTLDGWWDEAYNRKNGFTIGRGETYKNTDDQDVIERGVLFDLFEQEIVPMFYTRHSNKVPERWVKRMKESIRTLAGCFSTSRMVQEYAEENYFPAFKAVARLSGSNGQNHAQELRLWKEKIRATWSGVKIHDVSIGNFEDAFVGKSILVSTWVELSTLSPQDVAVEAVYGTINPSGEISNGESITLQLRQSNGNTHHYEGSYSCQDSGLQGCTVRVVPTHPFMTRNSDLYLCKWAGE